MKVFVATLDGDVFCWDVQKRSVLKMESYRNRQEAMMLVLFESLANSNQVLLSTFDGAKIITSQNFAATSNAHEASVTGVALTSSGLVWSISESDQTLRWFLTKRLEAKGQLFYQNPSTIASKASKDEVAIGTQNGMVWNQTEVKVDLKDVFMAFAERVVSLFYASNDSITAASNSGRILNIYHFRDKVEVVRQSTGFEVQMKILPANPFGLLWSLRQDQQSEGTHYTLSLLNANSQEQIIDDSIQPINDIAVSGDGETICLCGSSFKVLRQVKNRWMPVYMREQEIRHVVFLGQSSLVAVVPYDASEIQVWRVEEGLPTVALIDVASEITCLASRQEYIVAGCRSGDLISLRLSGQTRKSGATKK
jgi:WD40 repeat protein